MWKFEFGHPKTSAVTQTVLATDAQVTAAGLTLDLDVWGGCQKASWAGLTGPPLDNSRVWISVEDPTAPGGWRRRFSGCLTTRPSGPSGTREALGDKYHRMKWLPVTRKSSAPTDQERAQALQPSGDPDLTSLDAGNAIRKLGAEAQVDLPHLIVTETGVPDAGVNVTRTYKGQSIASACDALAAVKSGWGWTTRADDTLYFGPPVTREASLSTAQRGVRVTLRDVTTEGTINAVRWIYELPGGLEVAYESHHPSIAAAPRSAIVRYIDARSAAAVVERVPATVYERSTTGEGTVDASETGSYAFLRDGNAARGAVGLILGLRAVLGEPADWVDVAFTTFPGGNPTLDVGASHTAYSTDLASGEYVRLSLLDLEAGTSVGLSHASSDSSGKTVVIELNPLRLNRAELDAAAEELYHIPPDHAATVSEPGLQEPAGHVTITRPGQPPIQETVVTTRLRIQHPPRTEYVVGEPEGSVDAQAVRVIVDRKDRETLNSAAALRTVS